MWKSALAIILSTVSFGAYALEAAENGTITIAMKDLSAFSKILLNGVSTVRIHQGPQAVRLTIDENLLERYKISIEKDTLILGFECGLSTLWATRRLKTCEVDISMPTLTGITVNGAGTMHADSFDYRDLEIIVNGAGSLEVCGTAAGLEIESNGAATIKAVGLRAQTARVSMTGAGYAEVQVDESLDASLSGAGKLVYWGQPEVTSNITGAGNLKHMKE